MSKAKAIHAHTAPAATGVDWSQTYSVCITDDTASPRYNPGDVLHVHPSLPILSGNWVLIVQRAKEGTSPVSIIGKLIARDGKVVILQRLNPVSVHTLDPSRILSIHRIVGSSEVDT